MFDNEASVLQVLLSHGLSEWRSRLERANVWKGGRNRLQVISRNGDNPIVTFCDDDFPPKLEEGVSVLYEDRDVPGRVYFHDVGKTELPISKEEDCLAFFIRAGLSQKSALMFLECVSAANAVAQVVVERRVNELAETKTE